MLKLSDCLSFCFAKNLSEENEENNKFQRMPCLAHTLQLALKDAMKHPSADSVIAKARKLVHAVRKSSVANEGMVKRCLWSGIVAHAGTVLWIC